MAALLFLTFNGSGNQVPEIGLAQALRKHGHDVTFAGYADQRDRFTAHGFPFVLLGQSAIAFQNEPSAVLKHILVAPAHFQDVLDLLQQRHYDLMVIDCVLLGALAAAEQHHLPAAVMVHSAPGLLMAPRGQFEEILLGRVNELRTSAGLPVVERIWDIWERFPTLCASLPDLEPALDRIPPSFTYVGPIFEEMPVVQWHVPWQVDDDRPLILVSFSAYGGFDQRSHISRTLTALAGEPYRVLLTSTVTDVSGLTVPENAFIIPFLPHAQILPQTAAVVTHAGHGTVCAALAYGKPLVCLPNADGFDQPSLAATIQRIGAGIALDGDAATPEEIRRAVAMIIHDPTYQQAAQQIAETITKAAPAETAVAWIEQLLA